MKYPGYEPEVNAILDVARAADLAHEIRPDISATDIIGHLTEAASDWSWSLIEIIMDYEKEARQRAAAVAPPNAAKPVADGTLKMVHRVTRDQGETFAEGCVKLAVPCLDVSDVYGRTGIIEWPASMDDEYTPLQERYHELRDEIVARTMAAVKIAIAEAFVQVANEVIERERAAGNVRR